MFLQLAVAVLRLQAVKLCIQLAVVVLRLQAVKLYLQLAVVCVNQPMNRNRILQLHVYKIKR
jgi:hypothetical protein